MQTKDQRQAWLADRKRQGLCLQCEAKAVEGRTLCASCATKASNFRTAKEDRYRLKGLCPRCGAQARPDKTTCAACEAKRSSRATVKKTEDPRHFMVTSAKHRAREKGLPFDLTIADFEIPEVCPVLGIPIKVGVGKHGMGSPTLDRIVPHHGYVKGNVRVISWRANTVRGDATAAELEAVLRYAKWAEEVGDSTRNPYLQLDDRGGLNTKAPAS